MSKTKLTSGREWCEDCKSYVRGEMCDCQKAEAFDALVTDLQAFRNTWSVFAEKVVEERDKLQLQLDQVKRVSVLLNERVVLLRKVVESESDCVDDYFQGRNVGELAGTEQAADALHKVLNYD